MKKFITFLILVIAIFSVRYLITQNHSEYPVKGVDVSVYQGNIDWEMLKKQNIDFAFIKATEGSNHVDDKFKINYENAYKSGILISAYHFFSYDSEGETQAKNFINTVPKLNNTLPPVVDLEFYAENVTKPFSKKHTTQILKPLLLKLEEHYGKKPIIYATPKSYYLYLFADFKDYPIWIRDTNFKPLLLDFRKWLFWQYSDKGILDGYTGEEKYIDLNVFNGTLKDLIELAK